MKTRKKRNVLLAVTAVSLLGATAGALAAVDGEQGPNPRSAAAGPGGMQAQRVDLDSSPAPQSSPTSQQNQVHIRLVNVGGFTAKMCADNVVDAKNCTDGDWYQNDGLELTLTLKPGETQVKLHGYVIGDQGGGDTRTVDLPPNGQSLCITYKGILTSHHFEPKNCQLDDWPPKG